MSIKRGEIYLAAAKADQIRTLDQTRLVSRIGLISDQDLARAEMALKIHLALR
jgi:mRNA-degrading endonuclease toxin of MazEF toxin-antitoxin module